MPELTHFNQEGRARMVDVTSKGDTLREATACGKVLVKLPTLQLIREGGLKKGDVLAVAQVAGIMGAKKASSLIPMCHPLMLTGVDIRFNLREEDGCGVVEIQSTVKTTGKTGVEMEALTSVSIAALTIYDMCKAVDKDMEIQDIYLLVKTGGKSGSYYRASNNEYY